MGLRNPLSHFRNLHDPHNLERRAMTGGSHPDELLSQDAWFAIGLIVRILSKPAFRVG